MRSSHRKLETSLKRFVSKSGCRVRIWASREVERRDGSWIPHIHAIVDLAGADAVRFSVTLRSVFGLGNREVHVAAMKDRSRSANFARLSQYLTKVRYQQPVDGGQHRWMTDQDISSISCDGGTGFLRHGTDLSWAFRDESHGLGV